MGAIGGLVGLGGGAAGTGFNGPGSANISNPTNQTQISNAYSGTQQSMDAQAKLLQALQAQNGLGNQSQTYNQLQGVINGTGPNPAQAMLSNTTGQNIANQAALMAGQRGSGSNVGLLARQAAQQGGALQQNAAGQAAALQAQQSLNAINAAGGIANTQAANQIGQTNANTQAQQAEQQALINAQLGVNNQNVAMQSNINSANAGLAQTQMGGQQKLIGGVMNSVGVGGAGGAGVAGAEGGEVPMADGGMMDQSAFAGPQSRFGQFLASQAQMSSPESAAVPMVQNNDNTLEKGSSALMSRIMGQKAPQTELGSQIGASDVGSSFTMPSMGGFYGGGNVGSKLKGGGHVPGKPQVNGPVNSYKNDTVKALLSPGEIVIPRSVSMSKDPVKASAEFVAQVVAKRKAKGQK